MSKIDTQLKIILTSGRTIDQGISLVGTKTTQLAKEATGICFLDTKDMEKLQIIENQNVKIITTEGEIIVKAKVSKDAPHEGIVFMPLGIYANWVTPPREAGIGVPLYKGIEALLTPTEKEVLNVDDLIQKLLEQKKSLRNCYENCE